MGGRLSDVGRVQVMLDEEYQEEKNQQEGVPVVNRRRTESVAGQRRQWYNGTVTNEIGSDSSSLGEQLGI